MSLLKRTIGSIPRPMRYRLRYQWDKFAAGKRKKCLIYGNCQVRSLAKILASHQAFAEQYQILPIRTVYDILPSEIDTLLKCIEITDLLIYQPVKETYRSMPELSTKFLQGRLRPHALALGFPSLYFSAYSPEIFYLYNTAKQVYQGPASDYHNLYVFKSYLEGHAVQETLNTLSRSDLLDSNITEKILAANLAELESREQEHSLISISGFIREHYQTERLFHTMNHPSARVVEHLASSILKLIGLPESSPRSFPDILGHTFFNIHPAIYQHLRLRFANPPSAKITNEGVDLREMVERFFRFYDKTPAALEDFNTTKEYMSNANKLIYSQLH